MTQGIPALSDPEPADEPLETPEEAFWRQFEGDQA